MLIPNRLVGYVAVFRGRVCKSPEFRIAFTDCLRAGLTRYLGLSAMFPTAPIDNYEIMFFGDDASLIVMIPSIVWSSLQQLLLFQQWWVDEICKVAKQMDRTRLVKCAQELRLHNGTVSMDMDIYNGKVITLPFILPRVMPSVEIWSRN